MEGQVFTGCCRNPCISSDSNVPMPFLQYQVSRPGHFKPLRTGDASLLPLSPALTSVEQGFAYSIAPRYLGPNEVGN